MALAATAVASMAAQEVMDEEATAEMEAAAAALMVVERVHSCLRSPGMLGTQQKSRHHSKSWSFLW